MHEIIVPIRTYAFPKIKLDILHLNEIHPVTGGNKIFKLRYFLIKYAKENFSGIVSLGGPQSNHLAALGTVCHEKQIPCLFIIRGEEYGVKNFALKSLFSESPWIRFYFASRTDFRNLYLGKLSPFDMLNIPHDYLYVPMGGDTEEGERGASEIMNHVPDNYDVVFCAVGSGTTFRGVCTGKSRYQKIIGINCIKHNQYIKGKYSLKDKNELSFEIFHKKENDFILCGYEFGGPGKIPQELLLHKRDTEISLGLYTDVVYNAKCIYAITEHLFMYLQNHKVLYVHSGGMWNENKY
ncbi:MAG: hypothetical protein N3F09_05750 [Bacteroidia bacterium]|nr:hypothetical protein [Bacteroidia bacterium]